MAEDLIIAKGNKEAQYRSLIPQIKALIDSEDDVIANMANVCAALKEQFQWLWVGFYMVKGEILVLGPFQGPVACTRINKGKGVCGTCWEKREVIIVPDVEAFPGHIACSSISQSEIVLPIIRNEIVIGVLDVDSADLAQYDETDALYLQEILDCMIF